MNPCQRPRLGRRPAASSAPSVGSKQSRKPVSGMSVSSIQTCQHSARDGAGANFGDSLFHWSRAISFWRQ